MKSANKQILLIGFFIWGAVANSTLKAQVNDSMAMNIDKHAAAITNFTADDYSGLVLPPLSVLLESATNCPQVGILLASKEEQTGVLKTVKRNILSSFSVFGNYQYGNFATILANSTTSNQVSSIQRQDMYNTGAGISLPLDVIYDRKNKINTQKARIKQTDFQIAQALETRKMQIIEIYVQAANQLQILKVKSEAVAIANSDMKLSEINYMNGVIDLAALSIIKTNQTTTVTNYESTRSELNKAILLLELLTNVNIIKK